MFYAVALSSEGPGLSHEDRRSYLGDIELLSTDWNGGSTGVAGGGKDDTSVDDSDGRRTIFVQGAITVGLDMGTDTRAIPVAQFTMREVKSSSDPFDSDTDSELESSFE
mmetsp:Transcript_57138/g.170305  ORF Transcript_57138/g.170305 Transcript_57138/m.170305 type:complete len:109 (-) Transcript_57138:280-606(-)